MQLQNILPDFQIGDCKTKILFDFSRRKANVYVAEAKRSVIVSFPRTEVRGNNFQKLVGHFGSVLQVATILFCFHYLFSMFKPESLI